MNATGKNDRLTIEVELELTAILFTQSLEIISVHLADVFLQTRHKVITMGTIFGVKFILSKLGSGKVDPYANLLIGVVSVEEFGLTNQNLVFEKIFTFWERHDGHTGLVHHFFGLIFKNGLHSGTLGLPVDFNLIFNRDAGSFTETLDPVGDFPTKTNAAQIFILLHVEQDASTLRSLAAEFSVINSCLIEGLANLEHSSGDIKNIDFNCAIVEVATKLVVIQISDIYFSFLVEFLSESLTHCLVVRVGGIRDKLILVGGQDELNAVKFFFNVALDKFVVGKIFFVSINKSNTLERELHRNLLIITNDTAGLNCGLHPFNSLLSFFIDKLGLIVGNLCKMN